MRDLEQIVAEAGQTAASEGRGSVCGELTRALPAHHHDGLFEVVDLGLAREVQLHKSAWPRGARVTRAEFAAMSPNEATRLYKDMIKEQRHLEAPGRIAPGPPPPGLAKLLSGRGAAALAEVGRWCDDYGVQVAFRAIVAYPSQDEFMAYARLVAETGRLPEDIFG
jgi:hypothetical protein